MESLILALIQQLNAAVFTLIVVLLVCFWLVYKAGGIVKTFSDYESDKTKIETKMDAMKDMLSNIRATTDLLYQAHLTTVKASSPLNLTALGREISDALKIPEKVTSHWDAIGSEITKKNPQNPYDIQSVAMTIARNCFDSIFSEAERAEVKTYAFNRGMNLLEIYPIIGIEIRNRVLKERGYELAEVDKHDPSKRTGQNHS